MLRRLASVLLLIASIAVGAARAQSIQPDHFRYIVLASDNFSRKIAEASLGNRDALIVASAEMCQALAELSKDKVFLEGLYKAERESSDTKPARERMRDDLDQFLGRFLLVEANLLMDAKVRPDEINRAVVAAAAARASLAADVQPKQILETIARFQSEVCNMRDVLSKLKQEDEYRAKARAYRRKTAGLLIMVVDTGGGMAVAVATAGAGVPASIFAGGSIAIGGALMAN